MAIKCYLLRMENRCKSMISLLSMRNATAGGSPQCVLLLWEPKHQDPVSPAINHCPMHRWLQQITIKMLNGKMFLIVSRGTIVGGKWILTSAYCRGARLTISWYLIPSTERQNDEPELLMFPRNTHKQSKQQLRCGIVHAEENEQKSRKLAFILHVCMI